MDRRYSLLAGVAVAVSWGWALGCGTNGRAELEGDASDADAIADGTDGDATADGDVSDSDTPADTADIGPDTTSPGSFRWDLGAVGPRDFYAYPWPSALRVNARGAPDLGGFPIDLALVDLLEQAIGAVEAGPTGFSPLASAYFGMTVELDPSSLEGNVLLVDLDRGERLRASVVWNATGGGYWPARTLALHPDYQVPPRAGARLAAVLLNGLRTAQGEALVAPGIIANLDAASGPEAESLRALLPELDRLGLSRGDVLAWTVWRASDPMADLRGLAGWVAARPAAEVSELRHVARKTAYDQYEGKLAVVEALSGTPPYSAFGAGLIEVLPDGAPKTPTTHVVPFTLTVPRTAAPSGGFPIVLYGHGLGEDHEGFLRTAAAPLGELGVAVIGLDPPLQGARNTTGQSDRDLVITLSVTNIVGGREILRQGVFDYLQLARAVSAPGFVIDGALAPDGAKIAFDATRVGYFGHSEGAQIGALLLPLAPVIGPAVFSEGGGGAAITMLVLKLPEVDVGEAVSNLLGVDRSVEDWALGHPLVTAVIQPLLDQADPLHVARHLFREPLGRAHDVVMLEGFLDLLTPPASIEALASAAGLPIAEPVGRAIAGLDAQGIAAAALPATNNLTAVDPAGTATGALLQFPASDHYIIYFDAAVRGRLMRFLASSLDGAAEVPAP